MNTDYDVIIIGAGPTGENAADIAGRGDLKVAIVERELVGGECSYFACMPSKALLRPGEALRALKRTPGAREAVTGEIDLAATLKRRDALSANWDDKGQADWVESVGVDLIRGHARLTGPKSVAVELQDGSIEKYTVTTAIVLATGTSAAVPPIEGLREIRTWDNREITTINEVPERLVILGGGVIGVEMAQAWKDLGSKEVTIVEMAPSLIAREEPQASAALQRALEALGIKVLVGAAAVKAERDPEVRLTLDNGDVVVGDELVVAVGRRPNTTDIGLDTVGLEPGRWVEVDDRMVVTAVEGEWLYAIGDMNARALLTHTGKYQARVAGAQIAGNTRTTAWSDIKATPRVIFTDPHIAAVGMTKAGAEEAGINVRTIEYDLGWTAGAAAMGQDVGGPAIWVVDADREVLVGTTFVGPGAGEMIHAATIAIVGEVPLETLWHAIPSFPTMSEVWLRFLEAYRDQFDREFS